MEIIVVILVIVFALANAGNRNNKGRQAARTKRAARTTAPTGRQQPADSSASKEFGEALALLERKLNAASPSRPQAAPVAQPLVQPAQAAGQGEALLEDDECAGGSMPHTHAEGHGALEDEDCAGGSMAHDHTEGVRRAEHARRMAAMDARQEEDELLPTAFDARALRRAVVMAEVLGRPKALKR